MAKQNNDIAKATRVIYVYEAIKKIKEATPQQILNAVASKMGVRIDDKLKRLIYRDLKDLRNKHQIELKVFHSDGTPVSIDDEKEYKNVRHLYYIKSGSENINVKGIGNLINSNCEIYPLKDGLINWEVNPSSEFSQKNRVFLLLFSSNSSEVISVSFDELPIKLLIIRDLKNITDVKKQLLSSLGKRVAILKIKDRTISVGNEQIGHCLIEIENNTEVIVTDYQSTNGTKFSNCKKLSNKEIKEIENTRQGRTFLANDDFYKIFSIDKDKLTVAEQRPSKLALPVSLIVGTKPIYISHT